LIEEKGRRIKVVPLWKWLLDWFRLLSIYVTYIYKLVLNNNCYEKVR
jgi:hypothetical protein